MSCLSWRLGAARHLRMTGPVRLCGRTVRRTAVRSPFPPPGPGRWWWEDLDLVGVARCGPAGRNRRVFALLHTAAGDLPGVVPVGGWTISLGFASALGARRPLGLVFQCLVGLVDFGGVEFGVDVTGRPPVIAGGVVVAEIVEGAAEAGVGTGLLVPVLGGERQGERVRVVVTGLLGMAGGVEVFPQSVACTGLAVAVAELLVEVEGLPMMMRGVVVSALPVVDEAEVGQGVRLAVAVGQGPVESEGPLVVIDSQRVPALPPVDMADARPRGLSR